jgi:aryl-alcohol dehydrogenase-like predicted oxidoreductase
LAWRFADNGHDPHRHPGEEGWQGVPIPGTTKLERLEENLGALNVKLTADDLSAIETASSHIKIEGARIRSSTKS